MTWRRLNECRESNLNNEATADLTCCGLPIRIVARRESGKGVTRSFRSTADTTGYQEPMSAILPDNAQQQSTPRTGQRMPAVSAGTLSSIATGWQTLADQIDRYHARGPDMDPAFGAESKVRQVSIFLVEDETLIRMMIADMIEELGHTVVAEAANIADALRLAETADFGIAILDINIGGDRIEPVAEVIDGRHLPFVFASGYGAAGLPANFRDRPVLQKPFLPDRLERAIQLALR
jgi:CheY-like chemotaxis protein